jgi:hypothetical protein
MESALYGIEEEIYLVQSGKPSLESFYYLASLLWKKGFFNYAHTAANLSHVSDIKTGIMGGIEVSTGICESAAKSVEALSGRRRELAECIDSGLIVPMGSLIDTKAPTKTCGMHIHIGGIKPVDRIYVNLARFLPLLMLLTASSPFAGGIRFGNSYRCGNCPFIGPLNGNRFYRFQDIIISRRLKTIEIRIFDTVWDINRINKLLEIIESIVKVSKNMGFDSQQYRAAREEAVTKGYGPKTKELFKELNVFSNCDEDLFKNTPSDFICDYVKSNGRDAAYSALDNCYRTGVFKQSKTDGCAPNPLKIGIGLAGYYFPKIPYSVWKTCRELGI